LQKLYFYLINNKYLPNMKLSYGLALVYFLVANVIGFSNIASEGTASQSDTCCGGSPWLAIDGNKNGDYKGKSVTHTSSGGEKAWWRLTFASEYIVDEIRIWNRLDCCSERLKGFEVWVGPKYVGRIESSLAFYRFPKITAIASDITIKGGKDSNVLSLAEVEVFGKCYRWSNIAYKGTASESATLPNDLRPIPELAIDGNTDGIWEHRSVTHTTGKNASWRLKFDSVRYIKFLIIYNRMDNHSDRLDGVTINMNKKKVGEVCYKVGKWSYVFEIDVWSSEIIIAGPTYLSLAEVKVFGHQL